MARRYAGLALAALAALAAAPRAALAAEPLENHFGKEYAGLVLVPDAMGFREGLESTAAWAFFHEKEVRRALRGEGSWLGRIEKALGMSLEEAAQPPPEAVAVGLLPPAATGGRIRAALLVRLGKAWDKAQRAMGRLRRAGPEVGVRSVELDGGLSALELGETALAAMKDDLFALAPDGKMLQRLLAEPLPPGERLTGTDAFRQAMEPLGGWESSTVYVYFDLPALLGGNAGAAGWLRGARSLVCKARPAGKGFRWEVYLRGPGGLGGLVRGLGRGARSLLEWVPEEAAAAFAFKGRLAGLAGWRPAPVAALRRILEPLKALDKVGAAPSDEVLAALGDQFLLYLLPGGGESALPRFVVEASVADRARLDQALDRLATKASEALGEETARYRRQTVRGEGGETAWYYLELRLPFLAEAGLLAAALGKERLVVGTRREDLESALARGGRPRERNLLDRRRVAALLDQVGGDGAMAAFVDGRSLGRWLEPLLRSRGGGTGAEGTGAQPSKPPTEEDVEKGKEACLRNLEKIHMAIMRYADQHEGKPPASLDELVKAGLLEPQATRCPVSGRKYHYIHHDELREDLLLAYEVTLVHGKDRNFLTSMGPISDREEGFQRILKGLPERLRAKEPKEPAEEPGGGAKEPGKGPGRAAGPGGLLNLLLDPALMEKHGVLQAATLDVREGGILYTADTFAVPVGVALAAAVSLGEAAGGAPARPLPAQRTSRELLQRIGAAVRRFADENRGRLPDSLDRLVEGKFIAPEETVAPGSKRRFVFVRYPGKTVTQLGAGDLLAYEPAPRPDGTRAVLFGDGSIQTLSRDDFEKALARSAGKPATPRPTTPGARPKTGKPEVPLKRRLKAWLTMAESLLKWKRFTRAEEYCRKVLEKAPKGSLFEYRARRLLERCRQERLDAGGVE